jgi:tRNA(fMet)-specific endonuclease VapC
MICLDTNAIIDALNDPNSPVRARMNRIRAQGVPLCVSVIVVSELWYGAAKSGSRERNTDRLVDFLTGPIQLLNFDADDAREAGEIRAALAKAGTPIGPYDSLIAAQARRRGATLVTANAREFARVPGLKTEDWAG